MSLRAQWKEKPMTGSQPNVVTDRTTVAGQSGMAADVRARPVDVHDNAKQHKAVVKVETEGVQLVESSGTSDGLRLDQAHLECRLDDREPIQSTSTTMTFDNLAPGIHVVRDTLVDGANKPVSDSQTLTLRVP
jgi:hypothetical protein